MNLKNTLEHNRPYSRQDNSANAIASKLLTFICLTVAGTTIHQQTAQALTLSFDGVSSSEGVNTYTYSVTLQTGESLSTGDPLVFQNLSGVTGGSANNPYSLVGFDPSSANFVVIANQSGSQTFPGVITINSTASTGIVNYSGGFSGGAFSGTIDGPAVTPVPFEFSPSLGLAIVAGIFGLNYLRNQFRPRASDKKG